MRLSTTFLVVASLASISTTLAAPAPKVPGVRWPKYAKGGRYRRAEIINITSEHEAPTLVAPKENIFISLTNDEAVSPPSALSHLIDVDSC
jgi:hypothetical protein